MISFPERLVETKAVDKSGLRCGKRCHRKLQTAVLIYLLQLLSINPSEILQRIPPWETGCLQEKSNPRSLKHRKDIKTKT